MDVAGLRSRIPTTQRMTYLNTGWAGPSPVPVVESIHERLEYENLNGPTTTEVLESGRRILQDVREAIADLLNASAHEILLTQSTTEGLNVVMSGLPWQEDDEVVTCDLEHPAITMPILLAQKQRGIKARVLSVAPDESHEEILGKIEGAMTDRTRMVFLSHIEYSCGLRMPVREIGRLTKPRGIWLLLDGAQSAGHIPVDVSDIDCDFYSIPGQKWLLGPDGTGALYVSEAMIPVIETRVAGHGSVETFEDPDNHKLRTADIGKFAVGTSSVPLRAGFLEGIRFVQDVGVEQIEERNLALASSLTAGLSAIPGVRVLSPMAGPGCSGLVAFALDRAEPTETVAALWDSQRILIRRIAYPESMRVSLHFFNTDEEVAQLVRAVRDLAKSG